MKLLLASVLEADLAEISARLALDASPTISQRWEDAVAGAIELLLQWPEVGRERQDLRPEGKSFLVPAGLSELPPVLPGAGGIVDHVASALWRHESAGHVSRLKHLSQPFATLSHEPQPL